jgi:uncharacterized protein YhbP (UPF0306 family)
MMINILEHIVSWAWTQENTAFSKTNNFWVFDNKVISNWTFEIQQQSMAQDIPVDLKE